MADITFSFYESDEEAEWYDFSVEEYFWATVVPRPHRLFTDRSGESMWYFNFNMIIACVEAYRKMGETYKAYKFFKMAEYTPSIVRTAGRSLPVVAAAGVGMAVAYGTTQSTASNLAVVTGTPGAQPSKPWWMPLAVYYALYS